MFKTIFSFDGRINRTEYFLSIVICVFIFSGAQLILQLPLIYFYTSVIKYIVAAFALIADVIAFWFLLAQGSKRSHDIGKNGGWQLIPFYQLWLLIAEGDQFLNYYGDNHDRSLGHI